MGCDWSAAGSGQGNADSLQLPVKKRKEPAGNVHERSRGENGMFSGSRGREGWLLLWVPVRVRPWNSHRPFISFSLVVVTMATLLSGHSDWVSYFCQALKSSVLTDP